MVAGHRNAARAVIVGGGIGGLAAALCLHRAGVAVEVHEAAREIRPLGVGINLQPHSVLILRELGLEPALAATGIETAELIYVNKFGQHIWQEPRGRAAGYAVPQYSIHRGELQMILYRAALAELPPGSVRTGHVLADFGEDAQGVYAHFVDREGGVPVATARGDFLVAADGIHSAVRRRFYPDEGEPKFSGRILWRATTETEPFLTGRSMVWAGHDSQKFVCYPISEEARRRGRSLVNWIAELRVPLDATPPRTDWNRRVEKSVFREPFAGWDFGWLSAPALIDGADAVYEFPMVDRDPLPRWTHGRVTLLGDAAHPMYPVGSNGASQAILDARELADQLAGQPTIDAALAAYEQARRPPTSAVVLANRKGGPDRVLQLAEERAPNGFAHVEDVIPRAELEAIAAGYKQTAGFDRETVNRKAAGR
ncbi:MAG: flavin-dependent oxidoreductase [Burkholderiales bacterium]|nr:flavin-dependent oxidoreductase [Burkholderiales bacterium]